MALVSSQRTSRDTHTASATTCSSAIRPTGAPLRSPRPDAPLDQEHHHKQQSTSIRAAACRRSTSHTSHLRLLARTLRRRSARSARALTRATKRTSSTSCRRRLRIARRSKRGATCRRQRARRRSLVVSRTSCLTNTIATLVEARTLATMEVAARARPDAIAAKRGRSTTSRSASSRTLQLLLVRLASKMQCAQQAPTRCCSQSSCCRSRGDSHKRSWCVHPSTVRSIGICVGAHARTSV